MKSHPWLALAALSLLGMTVVPSAHSSVISVPIRSTPNVIVPVLPSIKVPLITIRPGVQLPSPVSPLPLTPRVMLAQDKPSIPLLQGQSKVILPGLFNPTSPIKLPKKMTGNGQAALLSALFDGTKGQQPVAVPAEKPKEEKPQETRPLPLTPEKGNSRLTLPEWDLAQEIGI